MSEYLYPLYFLINSQNFCKIPWPFVKGLSFMRFEVAFFFLKLSQRNFGVVSCLSSLSHFHFIAIYSFIKTLTKQKDREKKPEIGSETSRFWSIVFYWFLILKKLSVQFFTIIFWLLCLMSVIDWWRLLINNNILLTLTFLTVGRRLSLELIQYRDFVTLWGGFANTFTPQSTVALKPIITHSPQ